jgi:hypothetical protein
MAIDTRMNGIIHAALRRDLDRAALVLAADLEGFTDLFRGEASRGATALLARPLQ